MPTLIHSQQIVEGNLEKFRWPDVQLASVGNTPIRRRRSLRRTLPVVGAYNDANLRC